MLATVRDVTSLQVPKIVTRSEDITNKFSCIFHRFKVYSKVVSFDLYQCDFCKHYFTSRSSVDAHHHQETSPSPWNYDEGNALKALINFICVCDISLDSITDNTFNEFLSEINPQFRVASRNTLRKQIQEFAEQIQQENLQSVMGKYVYLLIDDAQRFCRNFTGIIIVSRQNIFFWKLQELEATHATDLVQAILPVLNILHMINAHVVAAVTDNASNMIKTIDELNHIPGCYIIRFACLCHTINLGLKKVLTNDFPDIHNAIIALLDYLKKKLKHSKPCITIRWDSYAEATRYIADNWDNLFIFIGLDKQKKVSHSIIDQLNKHIAAIGNRNNAMLISDVLQSVWNLINKLEGNKRTLEEFWPILLSFENELRSYRCFFSKMISIKIFQEIIMKDDFIISLLAFSFLDIGKTIITKSYYSEKIIKNMKLCLVKFLKETNQLKNIDKIIKEYDYYIKTTEQIPNVNITYWETLKENTNSYLADIAIQLLGIPCSEAGVERLFAHLGGFFNHQSKNTKNDLINYRLAIKMNYIFHKKDNNEDLVPIKRIHRFATIKFKE